MRRREPAPSQDAEARAFPLAPTPIHVPDDVLADLRWRLELTRWPDDAGNQDWYYGLQRAYLQELVDYWRTDYDWRKAEAAINAYEHYRVEVEGVPVHFMRRPGVGPNTLAYGLSDSPAGMLAWILERWVNWSDNGGDVETVFTKDDLCTHATIYWVTNSIGTSIRTYANNNRYPWTPSHDRQPAIEAPTGITFVGYENPPGVSTDQRVRHFLESDRAAWYNHVNFRAHDRGGHFIPWEIPDCWVDDLRRTFRDRR